MAKQYIKIRGANEHNLKHISLDIPRNELVVLTGLSGSGKSSLAFDTIYAEGQRRYMESLSSYARQFLGQMEKPDVESIEGLSPAISIDQKSTNRNPRSTVGTVTEIYDYMRLLYARIGIPHCPKCGREIRKQTIDQMVDQILQLPERTKIQLLAPVVRGRKGEHVKLLEQARKSGYVRARIDGNLYELSEEIKLEKNIKHNIEIVVDRLVVKAGIEKRLTDSIETVMGLSDGLLIVDVIDGEPMNFSMSFACPDCGISIEEVEPRSFSFNNPFGACPECFGLGYKMEFDECFLYSVFVYRSGYIVGGFFDIVIRIAHGYSDGCMAQHTDIVASITKCHCFFLSDTEMANDFIYSFLFADTFSYDICKCRKPASGFAVRE